MENEIKEHFEKTGNQPINPIEIKCGKHETMQFIGLTKREYFAGLAMHGMLTDHTNSYEPIPYDAVRMADALLAELDKPKNEEK